MKYVLTAAVLAISTAAIAEQSNLDIALAAGREMDWVLDENKAFLLVKRETIRSEVGLIFGYVDNEAACRQIAEALSTNGTVGEFECDAVH